jgi:hypothetical protein
MGAVALVFTSGCSEGAGAAGEGSGGVGGVLDDDRRAVPEDLQNTERDGEGGLALVAFTLLTGPSGLELYAAVRNEAATPACDAGMTTHFVDRTGQLVASVGSVLHSGRLYRLDDDSGVTIPCVAPGQIAMAAATELPSEIVLEELLYLEHQFPLFSIGGLVPVEAMSLSELTVVERGAGTAYSGRLDNELDQALNGVSVAVFPVNRVGRPLGVATSSAPAAVAPGGTWTFETTAVGERGAAYVAYPRVATPF